MEITAVPIPEGRGREFHTKLSCNLFAVPQSSGRRSSGDTALLRPVPQPWVLLPVPEGDWGVLLQEAQRGEAVRVRPLWAALRPGQHADVPRAAAHGREALRV